MVTLYVMATKIVLQGKMKNIVNVVSSKSENVYCKENLIVTIKMSILENTISWILFFQQIAVVSDVITIRVSPTNTNVMAYWTALMETTNTDIAVWEAESIS